MNQQFLQGKKRTLKNIHGKTALSCWDSLLRTLRVAFLIRMRTFRMSTLYSMQLQVSNAKMNQ